MKLLSLPRLRESLTYQGLSLGIVALVTSAMLVLANQATHHRIIEAEARDLAASLAQVLPTGTADNDLLKDARAIHHGGTPVTVYVARRAGVATGAVFQMAARGYAGDVVVLLGVDTQGRLFGTRVIKHQETPGLGDKIEVAKSKWINGFAGKSLGEPAVEKWAVKKDGGDFDQFTGATITPRAVVKAVKNGLEFFAAHRLEIFGEVP